jgi:hypothetical protein
MARRVSVRRLARNDTANTTARLFDIAPAPRNEMNMAVHNRLAGYAKSRLRPTRAGP